MDFDFWYLILVPLLFAAGWWARGREVHVQNNNEESVPEAYSRAVSLLVGDDPERGLDALVDVARNDPDLLVLHHVLGVMFRRRGEFEKAIRLHRYLAERPDVDDETHRLALSALGEDYLRAGLFDRAEKVFRTLEADPSEHLAALRALLGIYVTEHDWINAIDVAVKLQKQAGEAREKEISHFYCELADEALKRKNVALAKTYLQSAKETDPSNIRVAVTLGSLALLEGAPEEAKAQWLGVMEKTPHYTPLVLGRLADAMMSTGDTEGATALLTKSIASQPNPDVLDIVVERLAKWQGLPEAISVAQTVLSNHPTMSAFATLSRLKAEDPEADEETLMVGKLVSRYSKRLVRYQCKQCGFVASAFAWHCLGCGAWDSFPPTRMDENKVRSGY